MIKLTLNGQPVALFPDTKIGITAMNPYFNEIGAFSYPFTIPYIPNMGILQHAARIQNVTRSFIWDALLYVDGIQILSGEAIAEGDVVDGAFPIVLRSAKTSFIKLAESLKMQDLDWGIENTNNMSEWDVRAMRSGTINGTCEYSNYVCAPLFNNAAWTEQEGRWFTSDYINKYDPETGLLIGSTGDRSNTVTYNFYVRYILKRIIEFLGLTLENDDMSTITDLNRWFLLSLNNAWGTYSTHYKYAFPSLNVRDFLKVMREFGIVIITNDRLKTASIKLVRDVINTQIISSLLNDHALKDVPVMTTPTDGYTIGYKDASEDIITTTIAGDVITVANYAAIPPSGIQTRANIYFCTSTGRYYSTVLQKKADKADPDVYKWGNLGNYRPFVSGKGEEANDINVTVVDQRLESISVTKSIVVIVQQVPQTITKTWNIDIEMPEFNQKMNNFFEIWYSGSKYEEPPLVFLFNWGLRTYANTEDSRVTVTYPVVSGDAYGCDEALKGNISMRTTGEKSIITQLVKDEADWKIRRKSKRQFFNLSIIEYANFNWGEIQNISSVNYLVNSLKFDIGKNGISPVEAGLYTV